MPHGKKAASKTPMDAYVDGCRATSISTGHPTRKSRRSSSRPTSRPANASGSRRHSKPCLPSLERTFKSASLNRVALRSGIQDVVRRLLERDFSVRVAVRHPERIAALFPALHFDAIQADVNGDRSVAAAVAGVEGVVNAVSLYAESGSQTFHSVHVEAATRVARLAREAGVGRFIHVSGIGADAESASPYIRSRGKGEKAVREAFPTTTLIRPSIMFGRG